MSAQFLAAKAHGNLGNPPAPDTTMSPAEKAAMDKVYAGNNPSDELTPEALKAADDFSRGAIPDEPVPAKKTDGVVAAEPDPQKTPEELAAEEAAKGEKSAEEIAAEEEAAAEAAKGAKTQEELDAEAAAAEAAKGEKTPEELAAEEAAATEEAEKAAAAEAAAKAKEEETEDPAKIRIRIHRDNFNSDEDYRVAVKTTRLMNEFGLTPAKAEEEARRLLGISKPAAPVVEATPEAATLKDAETRLAAKRTERNKAIAEYRTEDFAKLDDEVETLRDEVFTAKQAVSTARSYSTQVDSSIERAQTEYPDSMTVGHPLYDAVELAFLRLPANDPIRKNPNFPELIAKQCADKLKISAKSQPKPAATTPPATPAKPTAKPTKVAPISGKARQVTPPTKPEDDLDAALRKELGPKNAHMVGRAPSSAVS
jgi:hypothetical protein